MLLPGRPSDEVADILATGNGDITTMFVSMATRHPDGTDAEYLQWHTLDHRPEQHRLSAVRASLRLVSTPACRAARAVRHERFDAVDHVMTYFFSRCRRHGRIPRAVQGAGGAGRKLPLLPPVERGVYGVQSRVAAARIKVGCRRAAVVAGPRRVPAAGNARSTATELVGVEGVAGVWSMTALDVGPALASARAGSNSPIASSTTTRSPPLHGYGPSSRSVGKQRTSNHCSPRLFTRSCRTSGAAMCRNRRRSCG